jgi:alpha-aminoadipate carrier protein LysW
VTTSLSAAPQCLVCDVAFEVDPAWERGEIVECGSCGQEHEVSEKSADTAKLDLAPEVEEDWGE